MSLLYILFSDVQEKPIESIGDLIESENTFFAFKDSALLLPQLAPQEHVGMQRR